MPCLLSRGNSTNILTSEIHTKIMNMHAIEQIVKLMVIFRGKGKNYSRDQIWCAG